MSVDVLMPQLGETVAEGKILVWFKSVGDEVAEGDNLFEVETDKVTIEVEATASGKLSEIRVQSGDVADVGTVVAVIGGASVSAPQSATNGSAPAPAAGPARSVFEEVATAPGRYGKAKTSDGVRITPLARRLIAQNGLDAETLARSVIERGGTRVAKKDVRAAMDAPETPTKAKAREPVRAPAPIADGARVHFNTIRQRTGERLAENWRTIPHVFQAVEVDFSAVAAVREREKASFKARLGVSLTYLPFIARAACLALRAFPNVNARFAGDHLVLSPAVNLGIAVDLDHEGLVVPVVANADGMTVPGLARAIGRQVEKARQGKLTPDDIAGATYSITNNGSFGTAFTAPIINAPQVAILSTDAIRMRPAVVETREGTLLAPRLIGMVGQSFDHRAFDGAYSAAFLSRLKDVIETRDWSAEFE